jgi:transketolase
MARQSDIDQLAINTIRMLAIDAVQKANSGHPGTPMDPAPTAYVLWQRFLRYDPADPHWLNRDRFVLSSGHVDAALQPHPFNWNKGRQSIVQAARSMP